MTMRPDPENKINSDPDFDEGPKFGRLLLVLVAAVLFVMALTVFSVSYYS